MERHDFPDKSFINKAYTHKLEELAKLFIGKDSNFKNYNRRPAFNPSSTGQFARTQPKTPQYVANPAPPAREEEEKKGGLFGSLKSVFKKPPE